MVWAIGFNLIEETDPCIHELRPLLLLVFSHSLLGDTLSPMDFRVTLNTGEVVTPITASFLPSLEFNERQTTVISGDWGNRIPPGEPRVTLPRQCDHCR